MLHNPNEYHSPRNARVSKGTALKGRHTQQAMFHFMNILNLCKGRANLYSMFENLKDEVVRRWRKLIKSGMNNMHGKCFFFFCQQYETLSGG